MDCCTGRVPGSGQTGIAFSDKDESTAFLNYEDFLTPDSLLQYDAETGHTKVLRSLPEKFDTTGLKVEQFFAESKTEPGSLICRSPQRHRT